jgi:hypothetical protein
MKAEHRMGRNYLKGRDGDRINAVLAAAGYNFGLLLRWLERCGTAISPAPRNSLNLHSRAKIRRLGFHGGSAAQEQTCRG